MCGGWVDLAFMDPPNVCYAYHCCGDGGDEGGRSGSCGKTLGQLFKTFFLLFTTVLSHWDFSHGKIGLLFPGESQLRQSRVTQPTVHAEYFSVSIIHRFLTWWTTGSLTCAQT